MNSKRTIADRLLDVQVTAEIARNQERDGNKDRTLYWLDEVIKEAQAAKQAILALEK
jgi:hypothetical protein